MTTALPPALAPWSRELSIFDRALALDLGAIVRRLASLVGSAKPMRRGLGDVDGFDGLTRRGPYDRLLHSEWLLADELPEEFARRAAMNEHVFFELGRQHPVQHPLTVALFDAGPSQFGAPRLVHLAALIVLARRATASEAEFRWGIAQQPGGALFEEVRGETISALLDARTPLETTAADFDQWQERLLGSEIGELWVIGPPRLDRFPFVRQQWLLEVDDVPSLEHRQVSIALRHDTRREPPAILDLPPQKNAVRLLTAPFSELEQAAGHAPAMVREQVTADIGSNILLVNQGRAIIARAFDGDVVCIALDAEPHVVRLAKRAGEVAVAAGWRPRRGPTALFAGRLTARIESAWRGRKALLTIADNHPLALSAGSITDPQALQPMVMAFGRNSGPHGYYFLDAARKLWFTDGDETLRLLADEVADVRRVPERGTMHIARVENEWRVARSMGYGIDEIVDRAGPAGNHAFFGYGVPSEDRFTPVALELADGNWIMRVDSMPLTPPRGAEVIGTTRSGTIHRRPALICIADDRRQIFITNRDETKTVVRTNAHIIYAATTPQAPVVAFVTADNRLRVVRLGSHETTHDIAIGELA